MDYDNTIFHNLSKLSMMKKWSPATLITEIVTDFNPWGPQILHFPRGAHVWGQGAVFEPVTRTYAQQGDVYEQVWTLCKS